jgi:hypothetical protein
MSTTRRQALYDRCKGDKPFPICNLCDLPITAGQPWDESHFPVPKALKGHETGLAHRACNRLHGAEVITPMVAKCKRVRAKHTGAWRPRHPMPCGRNSKRSRSMLRGVVTRRTLREKLIDAGILRVDA